MEFNVHTFALLLVFQELASKCAHRVPASCYWKSDSNAIYVCNPNPSSFRNTVSSLTLQLLFNLSTRTFGINALSGPVPKEIGLLADLRSL